MGTLDFDLVVEVEWESFEGIGRPQMGTWAFSDGSVARDKSSGFGVVVVNENGHLHSTTNGSLGKDCDCFQAEIYALGKAASCLVEMEPGNHCTLISDSKGAIQALASPLVQSETVLNTKKQIAALKGLNTVSLRWIKAHNGDPWNELADWLANTGRGEPPQVDLPLSWSRWKGLVWDETSKACLLYTSPSPRDRG